MKKIFNSRALALILVLAMAVSLFTLSVSAATTESLSGHGSNISSIVVTGADFESVNYATSTDIHGTVYDYYLAVPAATANGTELTATFTAAADQDSNFVISARGKNVPNPPYGIVFIRQGASNTYTVTMTDGAAQVSAYAHKDVVNEFGKCDTYNFHYFVDKPVSISTGDPVFIAWDGNNGTVSGRDGKSRIPSEFTLWVENPTSVTAGGVTLSASSVNGENYAYTITTPEDPNADNMSIVVVAGGTTYTISCPPATAAKAGTSPSAVTGYLPLGQFANNSGWTYVGSKFVDKKVLDSTGISLGTFGGFAEFYFKDGIKDLATNPYGVDFVIYGNAFNGNPEPGAVQVGVVTVNSDETETFYKWYELAGSNYYKGNFNYDTTKAASSLSSIYSGTLRNTSVTYTRVNTDTSKIDVKLANYDRTRLVNAANWWPLTTNYLAGFSTRHDDANVTAAYTGDGENDTITFTGITAVQDFNDNASYAFGYADVTPNGSPDQYGIPVNPYVPYTNGKTGGDGFDLAWAVDIATGEPVNLSALGSDKVVKYVRVYSAALDVAQFGETSPEITGVFTTVGTDGRGVSNAATIKLNDTTVSTSKVNNSSKQYFATKTVTAGQNSTLSISAASSLYLYVNGDPVTDSATTPCEITVNLAAGETAFYQIITQTGTRQPRIQTIKLTGVAATRSAAN